MNINLFFRLLLGLIFIGAIQVSAAQENSLSKEDKKKLVTDLIEVFYTKISNKKIQSQFDATKNIYNIIQKSSKEDLARNSPIIEILFNVINHKALNYNPNGAIKIASKAYGGPSFFWRSYDFKDLIKTPEYAIFLNKLINDDSLYNALYQELEKAKAVADRNEAAKKVKDANPNPTDTYSEIVRQNDLPDAQAEKESAQKSVKEIEEKLNQEPGSIGSETLKADLEEKQLLVQAAQKKEEVAKKEKEEREEKKIAAQRAQEEAEAVLKQKREDLKKQEEAARLAAEEQKKKEVEAERKRVAEAQVKAEEERRVVLQKAVQTKKSQVEQARNEVDRLGKEIEKLKKEEQSQWFGRWMQSGEAKRKKIEDMRLERGKALTILSKALQEETALQKGELVEQNQLELFVPESTQLEKKEYKWDMVKESGLNEYEKTVYEEVLNCFDEVYYDIVGRAGTRETGNGEGLSFLIWEATQQKDSEATGVPLKVEKDPTESINCII